MDSAPEAPQLSSASGTLTKVRSDITPLLKGMSNPQLSEVVLSLGVSPEASLQEESDSFVN